MLDKLTYVVGHYAALFWVVIACWGLGQSLLSLKAVGRTLPNGLRAPMAISLGLGFSITFLQWLAIAGRLQAAYVLCWLALGTVAAAILAIRKTAAPKPLQTFRTHWASWPFAEKSAFALLALGLLATLMAPLSTPLQWDELMYHLPHAREWALSGHLQVNEWLRYPWFPYNYNLLYAAALLFNSDALAHLLHATAGWLVAWLTYQLGMQYLNRVSACLASLIWVWLSSTAYDSAYIDMGVALFVLAGAISFQQWRLTQLRAWLVASAFLLGVAAGSKYQVLAILPFFAVALFWLDRRPGSWLLAALALAVPCIYWYARNAIATGDPFAPVGGRLFGFFDWNPSDYTAQFEDLRRNAGLPHWMLWPAVLGPWLAGLRKSPAARGAMWLSAWMLLTWAVSARYPRYLMTAFPLLALLAAAGWLAIVERSVAWVGATRIFSARRWIAGLLLAVMAAAALVNSVKYSKRIATSPTDRDTLLSERLVGYEVWRHMRENPIGKTYQFGMEGTLYYAPRPIWGEAFGPWRYRDYQGLAPAALHAKLAAQGFDALVVNTNVVPDVVSRPGFDKWFIHVYDNRNVHLYRLAP